MKTISEQLEGVRERCTAQRGKLARLVQAWRTTARENGSTELPASLAEVLDRETLLLDELDRTRQELEAAWMAAADEVFGPLGSPKTSPSG